MLIKKTVNVSCVSYAILTERGQMERREITIPRKLSQAAAIREAKKHEGRALIQMTVTVEITKRIYVMPFDQFIATATIQH